MPIKIRNQERLNKKDKVDAEIIGNFVKVFEILGSKTRLKILRIIGNEGKCVGFISKKLKLSQPTISYHLKLLWDLDLVKQQKTAQWVRYSLNKEKLAELLTDFSKIYKILKHEEEKYR